MLFGQEINAGWFPFSRAPAVDVFINFEPKIIVNFILLNQGAPGPVFRKGKPLFEGLGLGCRPIQAMARF
jgi:hypothetical protein